MRNSNQLTLYEFRTKGCIPGRVEKVRAICQDGKRGLAPEGPVDTRRDLILRGDKAVEGLRLYDRLALRSCVEQVAEVVHRAAIPGH